MTRGGAEARCCGAQSRPFGGRSSPLTGGRRRSRVAERERATRTEMGEAACGRHLPLRGGQENTPDRTSVAKAQGLPILAPRGKPLSVGRPPLSVRTVLSGFTCTLEFAGCEAENPRETPSFVLKALRFASVEAAFSL